MRSVIDIFERNPDDVRGFQLLHSNRRDGEWIFQSNSSTSLALLGLDKSCYSDIEPRCEPIQYPIESAINARFPLDDTALSRFLHYSLTKQNILKPYDKDNLRFCEPNKLYRIKNATVICTSLSIAVLDQDLKIVKECSHNAPEVLLKWHLLNRREGVHVPHGVLASVQQAFNLGHWLIDTLPKIWLAAQTENDFCRNAFLLTDTIEHALIRRTLELSPFSRLLQTLPFSVYKVGDLIIPVMNSFQQRVACSADICKKVFSSSPYQNNSITPFHTPKPKKIYLSRQLLERRKILNGEAVDKCMEKYGFTIVHPQCHDISAIKSLIQDADTTVGFNGAAFCNIVFSDMASCKKVGIIYPGTHLDDYYFRVISDMALSFQGMFATEQDNGEAIEKMIERYYYPEVSADYHVDEERLHTFLEELTG